MIFWSRVLAEPRNGSVRRQSAVVHAAGWHDIEDLADRLDYIGDRIGGRVVALKVKFGSSPEIWPNTG